MTTPQTITIGVGVLVDGRDVKPGNYAVPRPRVAPKSAHLFTNALLHVDFNDPETVRALEQQGAFEMD